MEYVAEFSLYTHLLCGRSVRIYEYITFRKKLQVGERERQKIPQSERKYNHLLTLLHL